MNDRFAVTNIRRVILVGKDKYKEDVTSFSKNKICSNELIFNISGESTVLFNGKQLDNTPGSVRFLPQGEVHEYIVRRKEHGECIDVFFDTDLPVASEAFVLKLKQSEKIKGLFKRIFAIWVAKDDGYYFECVSILYKILAELQKNNYIPETQYNSIKPAIDYIETNFLTQKITAESLSACCSISYAYIKKLFLKKFGMPPVKYSIQLKINYACDLLRSERYTITQTAKQCGYSDLHFFSRQFKEYTGVSPTAFMKKYKSLK